MKKILIVHNYYQKIGGEDTSVENEIKYLEKKYDIETIFFDNEIESFLKQTFYFLLNKNFNSMKIFREKLKAFQPDIVYIHNTWFKASLGIFSVLKNFDVEVVLKIHNFRYDCSRFLLTKNHLKNNDLCEKCGLTKSDLSYFNQYFPESLIKSIIVKLYGKKYFRIIKNCNYKLYVLTNFHRNYLKKLGFDDSKIFVFPNQIKINTERKSKNNQNYFIYAGRISKEKGVEFLIKAFLNSEVIKNKLIIIGDGPELNNLRNLYESKSIEFTGELDNLNTLKFIKNSRGVLTATTLYEGQPTLLCEASANGKISIFPRSGGISEFFPKDYEYSFEKNNIDDLTLKINLLYKTKNINEIGQLNKAFLKNYLSKFDFG